MLKGRLAAKSTPDGDCLIWTGATNGKQGYGRMWTGERTDYTHRISYEVHIGPIPRGLTIDHLCRRRLCINPNHLEPVTLAENHARRPLPAACPKGHAYTGENTYRGTNGNWYCRACHAKREALRRQRRR